MIKQTLRILQLYPRDMNIYGDWGNVLCLKKRAEWHGYHVEVIDYNVGDDFPENVHLIVGGGGQDSGQKRIQLDLMKRKEILTQLAEKNIPMLMICGMYQLFGHSFTTQRGEVLEGIGVLRCTTRGTSERLIGNIVTKSEQFGEIIGYENHSGQTTLDEGTAPFGLATKQTGNNTTDITEGARYKNVIGTYLHGSLLPKNPRVADFLIEQAARAQYGDFIPGDIDDTLTEKARASAASRPR